MCARRGILFVRTANNLQKSKNSGWHGEGGHYARQIPAPEEGRLKKHSPVSEYNSETHKPFVFVMLALLALTSLMSRNYLNEIVLALLPLFDLGFLMA
jgi:hypothetical protein